MIRGMQELSMERVIDAVNALNKEKMLKRLDSKVVEVTSGQDHSSRQDMVKGVGGALKGLSIKLEELAAAGMRETDSILPKNPIRRNAKLRDVRPMLGIPSPRDIPEFLDCMRAIVAPRLWIKYHKEVRAYELMRWYFLTQTDYTHLVILPDDLIIRQEAYDLLVRDLEESKTDYPVLCGLCNVYYYSNTVSCTELLGGAFVSNERLDEMRTMQGGSPIIRVKREGFALPFIRRDIVEKIRFEDMLTNALDYMFSLNCYKRDIPIYVDTRARLLHLCERPPNGNYEYFKVGKEKPYMLFQA